MSDISRSILIVDDDQNLLNGLCRQLGKRFELSVATSGQEALRILESDGPFAVALSDYRMPGMNGVEFLGEMSRRSPETVRIMFTQYGETDVVVAALHEGRVYRFLEKPCPIPLLEAVLVDAVEQYRLIRVEHLHIDELDRANQDLRDANLRLTQAQAEAIAANRAKNALLACISHEVRTPIAAIRGFADLVLDATTTLEEKHEAASTLHRNADYLLQLINDLMDLSRIEEGKFQVERRPCCPVRIVADVASLLRVRATSKGLDLDVEYVPPIPESIVTDPLRLRQTLINLVGNAIKFTTRGSVRIQAKVIAPESPTPSMAFEVIDTGVGIGADQLSQLFRPYHQIDASTRHDSGGSGLGLAISKHLAEMLGGNITVDSVPEQGSTFCLTVDTGPLTGVTWLSSPSDALWSAAPFEEFSEYRVESLECRILLVDDAPDNQRLLAHILRQAGAEVEIAENGQIAVERALERAAGDRPFDIILMDVQMPVMNGYEATQTLRLRGYREPIIALSAQDSPEYASRCAAAGCDDVLAKPIRKGRLVGAVRRQLMHRTECKP